MNEINNLYGLTARKQVVMSEASKSFSFNKEWYKSTRLRVLLVTAGLLVGNDMFSMGLSEQVIQMIGGLAIAIIGGKSIQDAMASSAEVKGAAMVEIAKVQASNVVPPSPPAGA